MKRFFRKNKTLCITTLIGILFVSTLGCLFHFVYNWSSRNFIIGLFTPVNESTWEHMKLIYFPMLLYCVGEFAFLYRKYSKLVCADLAGILAGTLLIPLLFYTYTGILGYHTLFLDIITFIAGVLAAFFVRLRSLVLPRRPKNTFFYFLCVIILGACFLIFTYYPPDIALFISPV